MKTTKPKKPVRASHPKGKPVRARQGLVVRLMAWLRGGK
jgi:hypothetical protein